VCGQVGYGSGNGKLSKYVCIATKTNKTPNIIQTLTHKPNPITKQQCSSEHSAKSNQIIYFRQLTRLIEKKRQKQTETRTQKHKETYI